MSKKPKTARIVSATKTASDRRVQQLEKQVAKLLENQDNAVEVDRRVLRLEAERRELQAKIKSLHASVEAGERRAKLLSGLREPSTPAKIARPNRKKSGGNATAIIVLSDWHVEETVESAKVNNLNEFNTIIAAERIVRTFQKALMLLEDARHLADIRELVVAVIGDMISGYIHEELVEANAMAPLPAARFAKQHLQAGLDLLLRDAGVERIIVPTCFGNHGRTTARPRISTGAENSFEQNLYCVLADHYRSEPRITWKIEPGIHNWLDVQGHWVRFHHGDAIKYQGGVGGISIPVNKAIAQWNRARKADLDVFGHWHQFCWNWNWVSNGCLIGYSPYALSIKADYQPPTQSFLVIDKDNGLTRALPIFCS